MIQNAAELYIAVQVLMGISLLAFLAGYFMRKKNKNIHGLLGLTGVLFNLVGAGVLVYYVYAEGILLKNRLPVLFAYLHRGFAVLVTLLMFYMAYTGITKQREKHIKMHKLFLIGYIIVYFSGMIVFHG
ncbi:MAG: hypothetical protein D6767_10440 [Candidatus Hydrogenedentota bacterium]|nr:MAG: hypothetical protein D6767_10440 [Candidatus Hydrogenedentota bacterium]